MFHVHRDTIRRIELEVSTCFSQLFQEDISDSEGNPKLATDEAFRREVASGFSLAADFKVEGSGKLLSSCIGAVDGIVIFIREPSCLNSRAFYNRKGGYALAVITACDQKGRFVWSDALFNGSAHDSTCWKSSKLGQMLEAEDIFIEIDIDGAVERVPVLLLGDAAFRTCKSFLVPYSSAECEQDEDCNNDY